jgi:3-hydroxyisobutyrate dehydrogenase-like beta-hydroxyacid dehydrogenase
MVGANGSDARTTVAVIGAGIMGSAMTRNLVAAGVNTRVWDGSPAARRGHRGRPAGRADRRRQAPQDGPARLCREFPLKWALKNVDLAISAAGDETPPLLAALSRQWHAAVAAGHGRQDISAARLALAGGSPAS